MAAMNWLADDECGARGTVVCAKAGIFSHTAPELGKRHQHNIVATAKPVHVAQKGRDVIGCVGPKPRMQVALMHMGVERIVSERHVVDLGREIRRN